MDILVDIRWHLVMLDPYCSVRADTPQAAGTRVSRPKPQSNALLAKTRRGIRVL